MEKNRKNNTEPFGYGIVSNCMLFPWQRPIEASGTKALSRLCVQRTTEILSNCKTCASNVHIIRTQTRTYTCTVWEREKRRHKHEHSGTYSCMQNLYQMVSCCAGLWLRYPLSIAHWLHFKTVSWDNFIPFFSVSLALSVSLWFAPFILTGIVSNAHFCRIKCRCWCEGGLCIAQMKMFLCIYVRILTTIQNLFIAYFNSSDI